ncbi:MAG: hypothetical protein Q8934_11395 [Bacillota bacterium]|nr:hypothetical protein [Bacillota bacterium]
MEELINCPSCGDIFYKNKFRDVCMKCWKKEEEDYETIYKFMRKRENRAATINQVVEQTGVLEETILKFIKKGRLQITQFPNLGYPCDKCGRIIRTGKLCGNCKDELQTALDTYEKEEKIKKDLLHQQRRTYYSSKD